MEQKLVKAKQCKACGCVHGTSKSEDGQQGKQGKQTAKGQGQSQGNDPGPAQGDGNFADEKDLMDAADAAAEMTRLEDERAGKWCEMDTLSSSGELDEDKAKEIRKHVSEIDARIKVLADKINKLQMEMRKQYSKRGHNMSQGWGDGGNQGRIGIDGFNAADIAPAPTSPMTKREFADALREVKAQAIQSHHGDLDERKMVDAVCGNEDHPWESIAMEPLSPVHIILAVDNSGSMEGVLGASDATSKATATAEAIGIIVDVCDEINAESSSNEGKFYTTVIKWSDTCPAIIKARDQDVPKEVIIAEYMKYLTSDTIVGPLIELLNEKVPVVAGEKTMVILITDGQIGEQHALVEEMGMGTRDWTLFGIGCHNPLFESVVFQVHEIQQTLFDAVLDTVSKAWQ